MRHLRKGRRLGRSASHRKALFRNMASSLLLTERPDADQFNESKVSYEKLKRKGIVSTPATGLNAPKIKGRIVTTLPKAKELRPYIEKIITVAKSGLKHLREAEQYATKAAQNSQEYKDWRQSEEWSKWNAAMAPALAARRRAESMLGNQYALSILFDIVAPRFEDRDGGYTRILKLATPRLGDAGKQAILEFVGNERDRVKVESERPAFDDEDETPAPEAAAEEAEAPAEEETKSEEG